jgi:hypothetical protein
MMKRQILLFLGFIFISAIVASAQTKTVTNADLEKFRQKRVQSEQDYRDNYQKLGLPSPEELEKQREQNRKELSELSGRLQKENLEREQRQREDEYEQAQFEYLRRSANQYNQGAYNGNGYLGSYPYYGYSGGYYNYSYNNRFRRNRGFGRGGSFYNSIIPGTVFPQQGVRINNGGVRISVTGGNRSSVRGRTPR